MLKKTRKGAYAEYLANYMLSVLGFTAPVPRQEDYGIDLFCSLNRDEETRTLAGESYAVQIKSSFKSIVFGKAQSGKWDRSQIDFLFNLKLPFFLCIVDLKTDTLNVYSFSAFRFVKKKYPNCSLITFKIYPNPGGMSIIHDIEDILDVKDLEGDLGDHKNYIINLGHPILQINSKGLKSDLELKNYIEILRIYIRLEIKNIVFDDLKWPHFHWPHKYTTNSSNIEYKWIHFDDEPLISNPDLMLAFNGQFLIALALSFKLHNRVNEYDSLRVITRSLPNFHKSEL